MTLDFARLGEAIRARAEVLYPLNPQEELIRRSSLGRSTVQRLWAGKATGMPTPATRQALERELGWEAGSIEAVLVGGEPTLRREDRERPETEIGSSAASARASAVPDMPLRVQLALEEGRPLDYDVLEFEIGGRTLSIVAWAQSGVYDTEEDRAVLLEQLRTFHRLMGTLRREGEGVTDEASATDDG